MFLYFYKIENNIGAPKGKKSPSLPFWCYFFANNDRVFFKLSQS